MLHYPKGIEIEKSDGIIKSINEDHYQMEHFCSSSPGSSGGPLFYLRNQKVIGIHKGAAIKGKEFNYGTFLKLPIEEFNEILAQNNNLNGKYYDDNSKSIAKNIINNSNSNINNNNGDKNKDINNNKINKDKNNDDKNNATNNDDNNDDENSDDKNTDDNNNDDINNVNNKPYFKLIYGKEKLLTLNVIILGDESGKDILLERTGKIGIEFNVKKIEFEKYNSSIKFQIWDTTGKDGFLFSSYFKGVKVIIFIYDATSKESFEEIKNYWYKLYKLKCTTNSILVIAANKSNLNKNEKVNDKEGKAFAKEIGGFFGIITKENSQSIYQLFENIGKIHFESLLEHLPEEKNMSCYACFII